MLSQNKIAEEFFQTSDTVRYEGVCKNGALLSVDEERFENYYMKKCRNILSFGKKTIAFYDEKSTYGVKMQYRPQLNYLIVYGCNNVDLEKLLNCYIIDLLIIDGSLPDYLRYKIINQANEIGQEYYDVKNSGAYVLKL